jgi:glycosyltransferase involved in cell wall biosynthesis
MKGKSSMTMDKRVNRLKVALIGAYPPPYGGVSIHIQRLQGLLSSNGAQAVVYDLSPYLKKTEGVVNLSKAKSWPRFFSSTEDIIHIHSSGASLKKMLSSLVLFKFRGKKVIITYHTLRYNIEHFNWFKRKSMQIMCRIVSHYIAVSPEIKATLLSLGAKPEGISVIPAFLPPATRQQEIEEIPQGIWDFIESHYPIVSANAYKIRFYKNQDLYGIDMCIDLCASLQNDYPQVGLVFCLPDIGVYEYFNKMRQRITEKGIENNFLFVTQPYSFYPILMKSHIFVRPTNTDGDAVSLREALYFKVPSVASDAVPRPEGTILFENRDINDFTLKVREVLANYEHYKKELETVDFEDFFQGIMQIYQKVASE